MHFDQRQSTGLPAFAGMDADIRAGLPCPIEILRSIGPRRQAHMSFARLLLEVTRCIQKIEGDVSARLFFAVGVIGLDPSTRDTLATAATVMIAAAIRRLHGVSAPELLVILRNHDGEIRFSAIDNSARAPCESECALVQRTIVPLGGLYGFERQGISVESSFCFLLRLPHEPCPGHPDPQKGSSL